MTGKVTMIDPPFGWQYGFPKALPEEYFTLGDDFDLEKWLLDNGYPEGAIPLALGYSRYWDKEVSSEYEKEVNELGDPEDE